MAQGSPTIEGFRAVFRQPSLAFAEISWRWAFGAAATALLSLTIFEYLDTLPVTTGDTLFLKSRHPFLISQALAHIIAGSGERLVAAGILLALALSALWILASSVGRAATLRPLLDYFYGRQLTQADFSGEVPFTIPRKRLHHFRALMGLSFLRLTLVLAGLLAIVSSGIVAGFVSTPTNPQPGLAFLIFLLLSILVVLSWSSMNWFLSIASIFVVREQCDVFGSVAAAVSFCLRRSGAISWSSTVFAVCHFVVFAIASSVVVFPLAFAGIVPGAIVLAAVVLLTLVYFAIVDFFYVGRLAAYVCILQMPEPPVAVATLTRPIVPSEADPLYATLSTMASEASVTQGSDAWPAIPPSDDDILSDIPLPPTEPPQSS